MRRRDHQWNRTVAMIACALVLGAEAWCLFAAVRGARTGRVGIEVRINEIARLQSLHPAPDVASEERLRARRAQLEAQNAELEDAEVGRAAALADDVSESLDTADVYFSLATYVDGLRAKAMNAGIEVASDERFGFKEYANAGPSTELAAAVLRQSAALKVAAEKLIEAQPWGILRIQRGRLRDPGAANGEPTTRDSGDYFEFPRRNATGEAASSCEMMFRIDFIGPASSLRTLLNRYVASDSPVVVRQVEVVHSEGSRKVEPNRDDGAADWQVVDEAVCRFSVVVEVVGETSDLISRDDRRAAPIFRWEEPVAQSAGAEWKFEVFSPPRVFRSVSGGLAVKADVGMPAHIMSRDTDASFGLSVTSLETELFRLQLVGFTADGDRALGIFENVETGETFLGGAGQRLPQLSASIVSFNVKVADVVMLDTGSTKLRVGTAVIDDERRGELVHLTTAERRFSREPIARVVFDEADSESREVRVGEVIENGNARYRIDAIRASEKAIVVTREIAAGQHETRALTVSNRTFAQTEAANH